MSAGAQEDAVQESSRGAAWGAPVLRVAILDRDSGFIQVLCKRLDRIGLEHRVLASPVPLDVLASMRLSALIVDLTVLGPQAWEWLQRVCAELPDLGVVVCTGSSTVAQRVRGLRLGADDWISKPCHPEEVIARVEGLVRRRSNTSGRAAKAPIAVGELEVRGDRFQAFVRGQSLDLTRREFELIELLAGAEGRVLEREEIYSRLWGYVMVRGDRSVDVFVRKLRQKLKAASPGWRYIHTHFGIGYRFAVEPAAKHSDGDIAEETAAERDPRLDAALQPAEDSDLTLAALSAD
jgi:DNA-binding response OmpR family regulator